MVASANYCPMGPWPTVFSLDCYSWSYGNIWKYWWSIIVILCCLSTSLLWWLSSQSCLIGLQSKTGMMPWTCLLNITVAGLGKPGPNGIVHICSRAFGCICWNSRHVANGFMFLSISAFMLDQYTDSQASSFVFSMPMWFVWSWLSACCLRLFVMTICLPLSIIPSFTASSSL